MILSKSIYKQFNINNQEYQNCLTFKSFSEIINNDQSNSKIICYRTIKIDGMFLSWVFSGISSIVLFYHLIITK